MPIKPENRIRYPKDWKAISYAARVRAAHQCEWCHVPNYAVGYRNNAGEFIAYQRHSLIHASHSQAKPLAVQLTASTGVKHVVIVLTTAHLDHTPENCDPSNLRALCQQCHLLYDADHHKRNAAITLINKRNGGAFLDLGGAA
ncbi:MAG: hypothetical protein RLY58_2248 [Pseudomonadota bacterium]|jgi:hypothetical protein